MTWQYDSCLRSSLSSFQTWPFSRGYVKNNSNICQTKQHETTTSTKLDMEHHATPKLELHGFEQGRFYWITGSMMIHHGGLLLVGPQLLNKESMVQMVIEWYWPIIAGMTLHLSPLMGERRIRLVWWKKQMFLCRSHKLFHEHATMFDDGIPVFVLSRTLLVGGFNVF